jgi:hypothetical protein
MIGVIWAFLATASASRKQRRAPGARAGRGTILAGLLSSERRPVVSELLIVFTLGYIVGGVSALALIAFTLAARTRSADRPKLTRNV